MHVALKKWGNSTGLRIPSRIMEAGSFTLDQEVDIRLEEGRIIVEPLIEKEVTLADLVGGITDDNIHDEVDFGAVEGEEIDL